MAGTYAGTRIGGYRLMSLLGGGAMGRVYLARDEGGRDVALKVLPPELARDERFRRRFLQETEIARRVDHPNVVRTLASGEEDGMLYLAMERVEGADLRAILRREGRLDAGRALEIVRQVADALDAAHAVGLVHRDVKPGNVLVSGRPPNERAFVCDFGLARHVSSVGSLTGDRGFVGTIDYVPPEQIEGRSPDARADVYSLACVLFECLTGARPFESESELAVVFAHLNQSVPRVSGRRPDLPEALDDVFATALAKSPGARYGSCRAFVRAVEEALEGKGPRRRAANRRLLAVSGAAVALSVAGAFAVVEATHGRARGGDAGAARASVSAARRAPQITETSIAGVRLGRAQAYYKNRLGGWRAQVLSEPGFPSLAFINRDVGVYFPKDGGPAHIITTWNRTFRTASGVGPCSTIAEMKKAYGKRVSATWAGTSPNGKVHWSWAVGNNLLFSTHDHRTIAVVALYEGDPKRLRAFSPQSWANYVAAVETPCK